MWKLVISCWWSAPPLDAFLYTQWTYTCAGTYRKVQNEKHKIAIERTFEQMICLWMMCLVVLACSTESKKFCFHQSTPDSKLQRMKIFKNSFCWLSCLHTSCNLASFLALGSTFWICQCLGNWFGQCDSTLSTKTI